MSQKKKTLLPVGMSLAVIFGFITLPIFLLPHLMKSSKPFKMAMQEIKNNAEVEKNIGNDVSAGMFINGQLSYYNNDGLACLMIPISGSITDGFAYLNAEKKQGLWQIIELSVTAENTPNPIILTAPPSDFTGNLCLQEMNKNITQDLPKNHRIFNHRENREIEVEEDCVSPII